MHIFKMIMADANALYRARLVSFDCDVALLHCSQQMCGFESVRCNKGSSKVKIIGKCAFTDHCLLLMQAAALRMYIPCGAIHALVQPM